MQDEKLREERGVAAQLADEVLAAQRHGLARLGESLGVLGPGASWAEVQAVVEAIPLAVSVEVALVGVQEPRAPGHVYVCAAAGLSARELGRLAFAPLTADQARAAARSTPRDALSRELGLRWGAGRWLVHAGASGALLVGSRTGRSPGAAEEGLIDLVAEQISSSLSTLQRDRGLQARAAELARARGANASRPVAVGNLRRREIQILELYGDGLDTREIAQLLVISPHTVRTHVRNALRSLELNSRGEAVAHLRRRQLDAVDGGAAKSGTGA